MWVRVPPSVLLLKWDEVYPDLATLKRSDLREVPPRYSFEVGREVYPDLATLEAQRLRVGLIIIPGRYSVRNVGREVYPRSSNS